MAQRRLRQPDPGYEDTLPTSLRDQFGRSVRLARAAQNETQGDLAARAGVSKHHVSRIESGRVNVTIDTIEGIARALGLDAGVLLLARSPLQLAEKPCARKTLADPL